MSIEVRHLTKRFGEFTALNDVSLAVQPGELLALLGPSGCGKTTLLRTIAGLEFPESGRGQVFFNGQEVTQTPAASRQVGFAFQHYALFRHLTVFENIAFGLRVRPRAQRPDEDCIRNKVRRLLQLVQLEQLEKRFPAELSGGQRQRVALARALAVEPKVLLLDEPFGALDAKVRKELRTWLRQLHQEIHLTSIFVTHDQDEALEVANRVVVMNAGRIEQIGTPEEVYERPANPFVYNFLGSVNLFRGRVRAGQVHLGDSAFPAPEHATDADAPAMVYVRPHEIKLLSEPNGSACLPAVIRHVNSAGPLVRLELERSDEGTRFAAELTRDQLPEVALVPGTAVFVELKKLRVFSEDYSI